MSAESLPLEAADEPLESWRSEPLQLAFDAVRKTIDEGGDADMTEIFAQADGMARSYCRSRLLDRDHAADAAQETLLGFFKTLEKNAYSDKAPVAVLLFSIARNKVADRLRTRYRKEADNLYETVPETTTDIPDVTPETSVLDSESVVAIGELLLNLPPSQRDAISLIEIHGMTAEEAAAATGSTAGSIRVAKHRGLRKLREMLTPEEPLPEPEDDISRTIYMLSSKLAVNTATLEGKIREIVRQDTRLEKLAARIDNPAVMLWPVEQAIITIHLNESGWLVQKAPDGYTSLRTLATEAHSDARTLKKIVDELGDQLGELQRFIFSSIRAIGLSPAQKEIVLAHLDEVRGAPLAPEGIYPIKHMTKIFKLDQSTIKHAIDALGEDLGPTKRYLFGQPVATGYTEKQLAQIGQYLEEHGKLIPKAPPGVRSVQGLADQLHVSPKTIARAVGNLGDSLGEVEHYRFSSTRVKGFTPAQQELIRDFLGK